VIDRLPPQKPGLRAGRASLHPLDRDAIIEWRISCTRRTLPPGPRPHLRAMSASSKHATDRRGHGRGGVERNGDGGHRRRGLPLHASATTLHSSRPRLPSTAHCRAQGRAAPPHRSRRQNRRHRLRGRCGHSGVDRSVGAELFAVSQHRIDDGFSPLRTPPPRRLDRLDYLHAQPWRNRRHRLGLRGPGPADHGFQASDLVVLAAAPQRRQDQPRAHVGRARAVEKAEGRQPDQQEAPLRRASLRSIRSASARASSRSWTSPSRTAACSATLSARLVLRRWGARPGRRGRSPGSRWSAGPGPRSPRRCRRFRHGARCR